MFCLHEHLDSHDGLLTIYYLRRLSALPQECRARCLLGSLIGGIRNPFINYYVPPALP